jgi:type VI secretion system protein ImpJ
MARHTSYRPLAWTEGKVLTQHDLQQLQAYLEAHSQRLLRLLVPFPWGIKSLTINEEELQHFTFALKQFEAILEDGTFLRYYGESPRSNVRLTSRRLDDALDASENPRLICLALKRRQWFEDTSFSHYDCCIIESETPDYFVEDNPCSVQYLLYEVRLLFGHELEQYPGYEVLPITMVKRAAPGQAIELVTSFIPPCVSVQASPLLTRLCDMLLAQLRQKSRELAAYRQQRSSHARSMGERHLIEILKFINKYIARLQHQLETHETHPYVIYGLLRELVYEAAVYSTDLSMLEAPLPAYQHERLWECFHVAVQMGIQLLEKLTVSGLEKHLIPNGESYTAVLDAEFLAPAHRYYLAVQADMPAAALTVVLNTLCKISAHEKMQTLIDLSLSGLLVGEPVTPPDDIPQLAHYTYYAINRSDPHWQAITDHENIEVYCANNLPEKTDIRLLLVPGEKEKTL